MAITDNCTAWPVSLTVLYIVGLGLHSYLGDTVSARTVSACTAT